MKLQFRPMTLQDGPQVLAWRNSPAVSAHMYTDHAISLAEHERWLHAALDSHDRCYWVIEVEGAAAGLANLARINPVARRCELGHYIADPGLRGRGVGAGVEYIILQQVFETRKLHKLWCEVLMENEGAWRLHESFGFQREALFRDHIHKGGAFFDVVGLGILAADWARVRPGCEARLTARGFSIDDLIVRED